ncbi:MAG: DNA internalization-related competence protein ComEC/Rec2 [Bacteroidetes bacterium]|nr:DNA internalization-related competence protein ComEC/Rec2 [Bacteroidota bacterium]
MLKRPALAGALSVSAGILFSSAAAVPWYWWGCGTVLLLLIAVIDFRRRAPERGRDRFPSVWFLLLLACSAAVSYSVRTQLRTAEHITNFLTVSDTVTVHCIVADEPSVSGERTKLLVKLLSVSNDADSAAVEGKAYVTILPDRRKKERPVTILYGAFLTFRTVIQEPSSERNPGEFSYKEYLALNDIYASMTVRGYGNVSVSGERDPNLFFEYIIFPSKRFVERTIRTVMEGDMAYFLIGLLLGDRTDLSQEIKEAFMNTGTIHVLAVSGSHVVLVAEIIVVVVGLLRFPRRPRIILVMVMLVYYMFLTGATPSVVRATLMMLVMQLGKLFEERTDIYNVLGVSAILILLYEPKQLFDVGFQLSFSAVFSIVYFYPLLNALIPRIPEPLEEVRIMHWVWQLFAVSLAAQIGTLPFTAYYFGRVSIVSLAANLIVVPIVGVMVTVGLSGALLGIGSLWIASCFSEVNRLMAMFTLQFVAWAEQVPYAVVDTATFGAEQTIYYSVIVGLLFNLGKPAVVKRFFFTGLAAVDLFLILSLFRPPDDHLRVYFLDVGQGDGAVIRFPTGETVLVDAGPSSPDYDAGERNIAPFLRRNGIAALDAVITTHPHADHLGGVPYILRNFPVHTAVDAGQAAGSRLYREYTSLLSSTRHMTVRAGSVLDIGGARLYVLHPTRHFIDADSADGYNELNGSSVVFKLVYGATSILFTGDAETDAEEHLATVYGTFLRSDLLKAGHHGSSTSSSERFISYVMPDHAVISVAKFNKFRHPSGKVIARLERYGAEVHRTDEEGAIVFQSDGHRWSKRQWRNDQ